MRILFLTQVLPYPLDAGPKIRAYYTLRHLARTHAITLVSFARSTDTPAAIEHLKTFCRAVYTIPLTRSRRNDATFLLKSLVTGVPFLIARDWSPQMAKLLAALVADREPYAIIHADQLWMAPYALLAQRLIDPIIRPRTVLDQHNAVYMIPRRMAQSELNPLKRLLLKLEVQKLAQYEAETCRNFDQVVWVTREDYEAVGDQASASSAPLPNSGVIPICSDLEAERSIQRKPQARRVTFLGSLHYPPNAQGICWFAEQVFPKVLAQVPDAVLTVIGKEPPATLRQMGFPAANLEITGFVPNVRSYLAESAAFVVPLLAGGGMRVKILDAWGWGVPIVSTTIGAEGILQQPGRNILIADTPDAFAEATIDLLQQPTVGDQLATAGRQWVEEHYNWRTTYKLWDRIYSE
jgi:polysaccharide biosynthesis protein PslH